MNQETRVNQIKLKQKVSDMPRTSAETIELPVRKSEWLVRFFQLDSLIRNFAVVGVLVLVLIAVKNSTVPEAQSVFGAIQESSGMKWDESVGKLSFVNSLLPEEIQEVWNETYDLDVGVPLEGAVIHTWSRQEPYLLISSTEHEVHAAANGEVMSIAHGMNEERIIRIRHENCETIYGNMEECMVEVGDRVLRGDIIGRLIQDYPLAFELRSDGRTIDPSQHMNLITE